MRITILIISILFSVVGFGQYAWVENGKLITSRNEFIQFDSTFISDYTTRMSTVVSGTDTTKYPKVIDDSSFYRNKEAKEKVDSMDMKVISMKEFKAYMERIDLVIKKQFDLTQVQKYEQIIKVMNSVYAEADKKRKTK